MKAGSICCYCISRCMTREVTMKEVGPTNEGRHHLLLLHKQNINFVGILEEYQNLGNNLLEEPLDSKVVFSEVNALI